MQDQNGGIRLDETARLQIRNSSALIYNQHYPSQAGIAALEMSRLERKNNLQPTLIDNLKDTKTYSGKVTVDSKRRIQKAVNLLLMLSPSIRIYNPVLKRIVNHRLTFITLTVSSTTTLLTASEAYTKLLKPFLKWMTVTKGVKTYVWKAELQKRGQVHYHLTTPSFIELTELREKWNYLQRKEGLLSEFKKKYGHDNPNSTDIHSVYKINNVEAYLVKYLAKAESEKDSTIGKIWDCSQNLKGKKYFNVQLTNTHIQTIVNLSDSKRLKLIECEHCAIIQMKENPADILLYGYEHKIYNDWLKTLEPTKRTRKNKTQIEAITGQQKLQEKPYAKKMKQLGLIE